jgi:hypothetical protein
MYTSNLSNLSVLDGSRAMYVDSFTALGRSFDRYKGEMRAKYDESPTSLPSFAFRSLQIFMEPTAQDLSAHSSW